MGRVIYVTGAPATGKSSVCKSIATMTRSVEVFCYSERLRDYVNQKTRRSVDEVEIRQLSAGLIEPADVEAVDTLLLGVVDTAHAGETHLLIDSHPVTKEHYGFRVTPFSIAQVQRLEIDAIICLYASAEVLRERIRADAQGRPLPSDDDLKLHVELQAAVATQYAVLTGKPCYLIDSNIPKEVLAQEVIRASAIS